MSRRYAKNNLVNGKPLVTPFPPSSNAGHAATVALERFVVTLIAHDVPMTASELRTALEASARALYPKGCNTRRANIVNFVYDNYVDLLESY